MEKCFNQVTSKYVNRNLKRTTNLIIVEDHTLQD